MYVEWLALALHQVRVENMAKRPPRLCPRPGCPGTWDGQRCTVCDYTHRRGQRQASDQVRRQGLASSWFAQARKWYTSARWHAAKRAHLRREPWCRQCLDHGLRVLAVVVDHIQPHRGRASLFWDQANWQSLCVQCHNAKSAKERDLEADNSRSPPGGVGG